MTRWLAFTLLLVLPLAGCTGNDDGEVDPTPTPATTSGTPTPTTRATPAPTTTTPPTATPSATPPGTPPATPPPTAAPPASTKAVEWTSSLTAGSGSAVPDPLGVGVGGVSNCEGFGAATILGGNATATFESPSPLAGEIELIVLAPDGTVAVRQAGASPITVTIPAMANGEDGPTLVVQFVEDSPASGSTDVEVVGSFLLPVAEGAPGQDGATTCERVA